MSYDDWRPIKMNKDMLKEFFVSFAGSLIAQLVAPAVAKFRRLTHLTPLRSHLDALRQEASEMPFIYRRLRLEILNDYVEIDTRALDLRSSGTPVVESAKKTLAFGLHERLRHYRKILLFGNAGIGKTSFQRYQILSLIQRRSERKSTRASFIYPGESPVPVYVQLKLVPNSGPSPIVDYILQNIPPFMSKKGCARLGRYAAEKRLFLFLDGYDEIQIRPEEPNFIQEELNVLMYGWPRNEEEVPRVSLSHAAFYAAMSECRAWLSTRVEFFMENPVRPPRADVAAASRSPVLALEVLGVGQRREQLVRRIFDRYRSSAIGIGELLDEEYFILDVDEHPDQEVARLSYNPLFLTMMCYLYAKRVEEAGEYEVDWREGMNDLILECVDLLLNDLDESKARELPPARKAALQRRRNRFPKEKREFLACFSAELFREGIAAFTEDALRSAAIKFFQKQSSSPDRLLILDGLRSLILSGADIVRQVIWSGVVVRAGTLGGMIHYDFPHRRFREVLASTYFATPERMGSLLAISSRPDIQDVLRVCLSLPRVQAREFQREVLRAILEEASAEQPSYSSVFASASWVGVFSELDPSEIFHAHLGRLLRSEEPRLRVSRRLLARISPSQELAELAQDNIKHLLHSGQAGRVALSFDLLAVWNQTLLRVLLEGCDITTIEDVEMRQNLLERLFTEFPEIGARMLAVAASRGMDLRLIGKLLGTAGPAQRDAVRKHFETPENEKHVLVLLAGAVASSKDSYEWVFEFFKAKTPKAIYLFLEKHDLMTQMLRDEGDGDRVFFLSMQTLERLRAWAARAGDHLIVGSTEKVRWTERGPDGNTKEHSSFLYWRADPVTDLQRPVELALEGSLYEVKDKDELRKEIDSAVRSAIEGITSRPPSKRYLEGNEETYLREEDALRTGMVGNLYASCHFQGSLIRRTAAALLEYPESQGDHWEFFVDA